MLRLIELPRTRLRWTGPAGLTAGAALTRLRPLLAAMGPHHAALLATPTEGSDTIAWDVPGSAMRRLTTLSRRDREAFAASLTMLLSDIRRAAETARAEGDAEKAALLELARMVPTQDAVFAVDGTPAIAAWGFAAPDRQAVSVLRPFDDGASAAPVARDRTAMWVSALALFTFAAAAVFAAPVLRGLLEPPLPACQVDADTLNLLRELGQAREAGQSLATERDTLRLARGRRQQDCPLPAALPTPTPPEPAPPPAPRPPPNARPCNVDTQSGGAGETRTLHFLGPNPGSVTLDYDNRRRPDSIVVRYRGRVLARTRGMVSGEGRITFDWRPQGDEQVVEVVVNGPDANTWWRYRLSCPK